MDEREIEINALLERIALLESETEEEAQERMAIESVMNAIQSAVKAVNNALVALQNGFTGEKSKSFLKEMNQITDNVKGYQKGMKSETERLGESKLTKKNEIEALRQQVEQLRREINMEN